MARKKKRLGKSARALNRRISRLENQLASFRGSAGGQVVSGWSIGSYTRSPADSEDALSSGETVAEKACESAVTREAYHQIKERASIRRAVIHGVRRAVSILKQSHSG